jgi:tetratricopeptide (TPR) repeat protein
MNPCTNEDIGDFITLYELDALEEEDKVRFEDHMMECSFCSSELVSMQQSIDTLAANKQEILRELAEEGISFEANKEAIEGRPRKKARRTVIRESFGEKVQKFLGDLLQPRQLIPATALTAILIFFLAVPKGPSPNPYLPLLTFEKAFYQDQVQRGATISDAESEFKAGMALYIQDDYSGAINHLSASVTADPTRGDYWLYLGISYFLDKQAGPAISALEHAQELCEPVLRNRALWYQSQAHLLAEEPESAATLLQLLVDQQLEYAAEAEALLAGIGEVSR